jgi:hypothetical protein
MMAIFCCLVSLGVVQLPFEDKTQVEVTLRPTVSRPVYLGVTPHLGLKTRLLLLSVAVLSVWGVFSDERTGLLNNIYKPSPYLTGNVTLLLQRPTG